MHICFLCDVSQYITFAAVLKATQSKKAPESEGTFLFFSEFCFYPDFSPGFHPFFISGR